MRSLATLKIQELETIQTFIRKWQLGFEQGYWHYYIHGTLLWHMETITHFEHEKHVSKTEKRRCLNNRV